MLCLTRPRLADLLADNRASIILAIPGQVADTLTIDRLCAGSYAIPVRTAWLKVSHVSPLPAHIVTRTRAQSTLQQSLTHSLLRLTQPHPDLTAEPLLHPLGPGGFLLL